MEDRAGEGAWRTAHPPSGEAGRHLFPQGEKAGCSSAGAVQDEGVATAAAEAAAAMGDSDLARAGGMDARIKSGHDDGSAASSRDVDLDALRRAYELSGETVASIQERFGLTAWQLRKHRERGGWTTRQPAAAPGLLRGHKPIGEEALELRLNRLVAIGAAMLERRLAKEGMTEANARMLTELCRAQESRMRTIKNKNGRIREKKNNDAGRDLRDDPDWLIAELSRRLDRLSEADAADGAARAGSGDHQQAGGGER